uniref:Large ribosomal subunit protein bL20c n=2 Tax=Isochrysidaceae TaxID=418951 RepID=A0A3T0NKH2_9EUKA|nr:ribosomal protein L20 [Tisochrysis lutea]YP_009873600.1 ribosomal protein L20 [Isochrysis galbana]AZW07326.1 ribosomal protein L20 [Tisochrysis lutea]QKW88483.1 ribosomal protein L20 [Isochrysis galbana]
MVRVKRGNVAIKRRKKIMKLAKGFKGAHSRLFRTANGQVMKALVYSYIGRKRRKRDFKRLWICRVNAASRAQGLTYSKLRNLMRNSSLVINVKMLAQLALFDKKAFCELITLVKN